MNPRELRVGDRVVVRLGSSRRLMLVDGLRDDIKDGKPGIVGVKIATLRGRDDLHVGQRCWSYRRDVIENWGPEDVRKFR